MSWLYLAGFVSGLGATLGVQRVLRYLGEVEESIEDGLVEEGDDIVTHWATPDVPAMGQHYQVNHDEWRRIDGKEHRTIYDWSYIDIEDAADLGRGVAGF